MDLYGARSADDGCGVAAHEQYIKIHRERERERERERDGSVRSAKCWALSVDREVQPRTILYHTDTCTHRHKDTHRHTDTHAQTPAQTHTETDIKTHT
jgi:hypothetical protein